VLSLGIILGPVWLFLGLSYYAGKQFLNVFCFVVGLAFVDYASLLSDSGDVQEKQREVISNTYSLVGMINTKF
jgi:hypothetical protein